VPDLAWFAFLVREVLPIFYHRKWQDAQSGFGRTKDLKLGMQMSSVLNEPDEDYDDCGNNENVNVSSQCIGANQANCPENG
jgi:hypothetical protein